MDCVLRKLKKKKERWELVYRMEEQYIDQRPTQEEEEHLLILEAQVNYNTILIDSLEQAKDSANSEKIIGHVVFYPSHETSTRTPGYLKDWVFMESDKNKYPKGFQNKVFISAASDITFGETGAIEAAVRESGRDGKHYVCRELLIVPLDGRGQFSKVRDFGSCVFGKDDRVIGMVVGGDGVLERGLGGGEVMPEKEAQSKGMKQWHDYDDDDAVGITFATPIDWIFDDIWDLTGFKPRLLGYPK
ncbi:hypothetical protein ANO14919_024040 [Xylariales sp. No.14919]|nr:hypothetical protein ANO14919_024040 [Xylariales sp. No.14919]